MDKILVLAAAILLISGVSSAISYVSKDTPMTCLKSCCKDACGNGQWDADGGFCHGPSANSVNCISCQDACRAEVGTAGTRPLTSSQPSLDPFSLPSSSSSSNESSNGSAGLCGLPAAIAGLVCGAMVLRKAKK
jgi:hypothetical protein